MKFSLHSLHGGVKNIDQIHQRARRAEELGYDGVFLGESHLSSIDSFQTLASCAMITQRVLLGIAVTTWFSAIRRYLPAPPPLSTKSPKAAPFLASALATVRCTRKASKPRP